MRYASRDPAGSDMGHRWSTTTTTTSNLDAVKKNIRQESDVEILTFANDVKDTQAAAKAVEDTIAHFGRLDVVVANAGANGTPARKHRLR